MKRWMMVGVVALAVLLIGGVAVAAETDVPAVDQATDTVTDASIERHVDLGKLWAKGQGHVTLQARAGMVKMAVAGDVVITGPTDLEVYIDGTRRLATAEDGMIRIALDDFTGHIGVRGRQFEIQVVGKTKFDATGIGRAVLRGEGVWRTRHAAGTWPVILNNAR